MQTFMRYMIIVLLITGWVETETNAQTDFSLSMYLIKDDNAYQSRTQYEEMINTTSLRIGRTFSWNDIRFYGFYNGDLSVFSENKGMRNISNSFGLAGRYSSGNYIIDMGAAGMSRRNKDEFVYFNVDTYSMYANMSFEPDFTSIYKLGVNLNKSNFTEFSDIDNRHYRVFAKMQKSFQNRSSITVETGIGVKDYVNQSIVDFFGLTMGQMPWPRLVETPVRATQADFSLKAAKSLGSMTGLSASVNFSRYLGDPIEAYSDGIYYYTENDLYDDVFSYENSSATLQLTRQFGVGFLARAAYTFYDKNYSGTPALDEQGELLGTSRYDQRNEYSFVLSKKVKTEWSFPGSFELFFRYMMRDNKSNDPYYSFTDHVGLLGFTIGK